MAARDGLHYSGNTIDAPRLGDSHLKKVMARPKGHYDFQGLNLPVNQRDPKVYVVKRCPWCSYKAHFWFITCPNCQNCSWCGLMDNVDPNQCYLCGNFLPEKLRNKIHRLPAQ